MRGLHPPLIVRVINLFTYHTTLNDHFSPSSAAYNRARVFRTRWFSTYKCTFTVAYMRNVGQCLGRSLYPPLLFSPSCMLLWLIPKPYRVLWTHTTIPTPRMIYVPPYGIWMYHTIRVCRKVFGCAERIHPHHKGDLSVGVAFRR